MIISFSIDFFFDSNLLYLVDLKPALFTGILPIPQIVIADGQLLPGLDLPPGAEGDSLVIISL